MAMAGAEDFGTEFVDAMVVVEFVVVVVEAPVRKQGPVASVVVDEGSTRTLMVGVGRIEVADASRIQPDVVVVRTAVVRTELGLGLRPALALGLGLRLALEHRHLLGPALGPGLAPGLAPELLHLRLLLRRLELEQIARQMLLLSPVGGEYHP